MILLVADDPNDELLTFRALKMNNIKHEIIVVHDRIEALAFFFCRSICANRDPHNLPQLILLDIKLPKMDGLEVLRHLRANQHTHLLPVVILSSSRESENLIKAYKNGADSCLRKPMDFTQFMEYTRQLSLYWLQLNEGPLK